MRRAPRPILALLTAAGLLLGGAASGETVVAARYADPTTRYDHGVLGDSIEHGALILDLDSGRRLRITLPESAVFEDTEPRIADLDGDGQAEVLTVESSLSRGARLAIYDQTGLVAATPHIGQAYRWLAPVGAADLDGDGRIDIAYVDRPHLAKTLRLWTFSARKLKPLAELPGVTNHRIGERDIAGGIRTCAGAPEMILASANWSRLVAVRFEAGHFRQSDLGTDTSRAAFAAAMDCRI